MQCLDINDIGKRFAISGSSAISTCFDLEHCRLLNLVYINQIKSHDSMWSLDKFRMAIIAATIHDLFLLLQQFTKLRYKKNLNITLALKRNQFWTSLKLSRPSNKLKQFQ